MAYLMQLRILKFFKNGTKSNLNSSLEPFDD
jgi:hypothetical protein